MNWRQVFIWASGATLGTRVDTVTVPAWQTLVILRIKQDIHTVKGVVPKLSSSLSRSISCFKGWYRSLEFCARSVHVPVRTGNDGVIEAICF